MLQPSVCMCVCVCSELGDLQYVSKPRGRANAMDITGHMEDVRERRGNS